MARLLDFDEPQYVYILDVKAITDDQRERLIDRIVQEFDLSADYVATILDGEGLPILASDVMVPTNRHNRDSGG